MLLRFDAAHGTAHCVCGLSCPCVSRACSSAPNLRAWDVSSFWLKESLPRRELSAAPRARARVCVRAARGFSRAGARAPKTRNANAQAATRKRTPAPPAPSRGRAVSACVSPRRRGARARVCIKEITEKQTHSLVTRVYDHDDLGRRALHTVPPHHNVHMVSVCRGGRHIFGSLPDPLGHPGPVHARLVSPR